MPRSRSPFSTRVHHYRSPHTPHATAYEVGLASARNAYIFIGGLGDGPHTVPYPRAVAKHLENLPDLSYSVFEIRMKSSFDGWGYSSLVQDAEEISALAKYIRSLGREKIVLSGHSTGCQVRHYHPDITVSILSVIQYLPSGHYGIYLARPQGGTSACRWLHLARPGL